MAPFIVRGRQFLTRPEHHRNDLATVLGQLSSSAEYADVTIHCKGGVRIRTNRNVLTQCSKLLRNIFDSKLNNNINYEFVNLNYDLVCTDFEPEAVKQIISLLYTGKASLVTEKLFEEMQVIVDNLQLNIPLKELKKSVETTSSVTNPLVVDDDDQDDEVVDLSEENPSSIFSDKFKFQLLQTFSCPICNKTFSLKAALISHTMKHQKTIENHLTLNQMNESTNSGQTLNTITPVQQFNESKFNLNQIDQSSYSSDRLSSSCAPLSNEITTHSSSSHAFQREQSPSTRKVKTIKDFGLTNETINQFNHSNNSKAIEDQLTLNSQSTIGETLNPFSNQNANENQTSNETTSLKSETSVNTGSYSCTICAKNFHYSIALQKHQLKHKPSNDDLLNSDDRMTHNDSNDLDELHQNDLDVKPLMVDGEALKRIFAEEDQVIAKLLQSRLTNRRFEENVEQQQSDTLTNHRLEENIEQQQSDTLTLDVFADSKNELRNRTNIIPLTQMDYEGSLNGDTFRSNDQTQINSGANSNANVKCEPINSSELMASSLPNNADSSSLQSNMQSEETLRRTNTNKTANTSVETVNNTDNDELEGTKNTKRNLSNKESTANNISRSFQNNNESSSNFLNNSHTKEDLLTNQVKQDRLASSLICPTIINGVEKFQCKLCQKMASSHGNLIMHIAFFHFRQQLYKINEDNQSKCITCDRTFVGNQSLVNHLATVHNGLDIVIEADKKLHSFKETKENFEYHCQKCPRVTRSKYLMTIHLGKTHYRNQVENYFTEKEGECQFCSKISDSQETLIKHLVISHSILKPYLQEAMKVEKKKSDNVTKDTLTKDTSTKDTSTKDTSTKDATTDDTLTEIESDESKIRKILSAKDQLKSPSNEVNTSNSKKRKAISETTTSSPTSGKSLKDETAIFRGFSSQEISTSHPKRRKSLKEEPAIFRCLSSQETTKDNRRSRNSSNGSSSGLTGSTGSNGSNGSTGSSSGLTGSNGSTGSTGFQCHRCSSTKKTYPLLLQHLAVHHFKEELRQFFGPREGECNICFSILLNEDCLLQHLAVLHGALDRFIRSKTSLQVSN
jgi:hypothetical protein